MNKTITIGCPISNREYLIDRYLNGILGLNYNKKLIKLYFVINNSNDSTESDLKDFKRKYKDEYLDIKIERYKISRQKDARITSIRLKTYSRLAELRNYVLSNIDTDYFFSVDSDIMLDINPECLNMLLEANKDIIACVINNDSILQPLEKYPKIRTNLLMNVKGGITHYLNFPLNEVFKVDHTGAVYLMRREVYENVRYGFHVQGEDMYFCNMAREKGYEIYAHGGIFLEHVMREYQDYCIKNKCQNPCMRADKKLYTYQYKFLDNDKKSELVRCPYLKKGGDDDKALFTNEFYNPLNELKDDLIDCVNEALNTTNIELEDLNNG